MIELSSNRIILGLYDSNKKESIIREQLLRIEDLENNLDKFDCIGQGNLENEMIENIIKINESQILINIKNNFCIIYERKNEISEKLKKELKDINKNKLIKNIDADADNINQNIMKNGEMMNNPIINQQETKIITFNSGPNTV